MINYRGKLASCHVQALFNAFFKNATYNEYLVFEALTTTAFGVKYVPGDPNRILDSYLDFDLALDRALDVLGIKYRVSFFDISEDSEKATLQLKEWLKKDAVVVGPLSMQYIRYLYYPQLYNGLDHYLVITEYKNEKFYVVDSEGMASVSLTVKEFIRAWLGDKVIEGRGGFMMRQVLGEKLIRLTEEVTHNTLRNILTNLNLSQNGNSNCTNAYNCISKQNLDDNPYLKNGLAYAIPIRLQRSYIQRYFFKKINAYNGIDTIVLNQISIMNEIYYGMMEEKNYMLPLFDGVSLLEGDLINHVQELVESI